MIGEPMSDGQYRHRQAAWSLIVDGRDIGAEIRPRLISLNLTEKRGADADELEIALSDHDGQLQIPPKGAIITCALGWRDLGSPVPPQLIDKGQFKVDETSHAGTPDILTIRARSADLTNAFRQRRTTSWSDTTLGDVLADIADRNALQLHCSPELSEISLKHLAQSRESDAALMARLGRKHDAVATVKAGALIFMPHGAGVSPGGRDIGAATITRVDGDRHSWKEVKRGTYSGVIAEWHDRDGATRSEVVAGTDENAKRLSRTYASEEAALQAAEAEYKRLGRGAAEFSLTLAFGRPDIFPEKTVNVFGWKPEIDAPGWLVTEARHSLGSSGFGTSLQLELGGSSNADKP